MYTHLSPSLSLSPIGSLYPQIVYIDDFPTNSQISPYSLVTSYHPQQINPCHEYHEWGLEDNSNTKNCQFSQGQPLVWE